MHEDPRSVLLVYDPVLATYRLSPSHPLQPERFTLAVALMSAWELLGDADDQATRIVPGPASEADLALVHDIDYVRFVKEASRHPERGYGRGIGPGDTPAFAGMHEASALAAGSTMLAVDSVLSGDAQRTFSPAGGLHHAHADHASGFCIYNDVAVAIERAIRREPGLRVAYVDIDAHHGDGVEALFYDRGDVLTVSVHESGRYLFPGTGRSQDIGVGAGHGAAVNVPLPPFAGPECYEMVFEQVIAPSVRAFSPDLIVGQIGGDTHRGDPLTHLYQSVAGFHDLVGRLIRLADEVTGGRIVLTGGGGYLPFSEVPRMWAGALALLLGRPVPEMLPEAWLEQAREAASAAGREYSHARRTYDEELPDLAEDQREAALEVTAHAVRQTREASPLLEGTSS